MIFRITYEPIFLTVCEPIWIGIEFIGLLPSHFLDFCIWDASRGGIDSHYETRPIYFDDEIGGFQNSFRQLFKFDHKSI